MKLIQKTCILFFISILISCSNNSDDIEIVIKERKLTNVIPDKATIGDTILVQGVNLDILTIKFNDYFGEIISNDNSEIKVIIPNKVNNENATIQAMMSQVSVVDTLPFQLIGFFPLSFPDSEYGDLRNVDLVNDTTGYLSVGNRLYQTNNGGYTWTKVNTFDSFIAAISFYNKNTGYISLENANMVYVTNDGGNSFKKIDLGNDTWRIRDMYFSSPTNGYFLSSKGDIIEIKDDSNINLLYEFPMSNRGSNTIDFTSFSVWNNLIMATGLCPGDDNKPYLIIYKNGIPSYKYFKDELLKVQVLNEEEAFMIMGNNLFFSNDTGNNWEIVSDSEIYNFIFWDKNNGIGVFPSENDDNDLLKRTFDGGKSWQDYGTMLGNFQYVTDMSYFNGRALITGYRGKLWKFIKD